MGAGSYNPLRPVLGTALLEQRRVHDQELHDEVAMVSDLNGDGEGQAHRQRREARAHGWEEGGRLAGAWCPPAPESAWPALESAWTRSIGG